VNCSIPGTINDNGVICVDLGARLFSYVIPGYLSKIL